MYARLLVCTVATHSVHLCLLMYLSTHCLCMPTIAQEIIIGMVNGEQWSYTGHYNGHTLHVQESHVCMCVLYIHLYTYTLYKSCTSFTVVTLVIVYIAALPVYVMSETSVYPELVRPWSLFGSWHAHSSMPLMGTIHVLDWVHSVLVNKLKVALHGN